RVLIESGAGEAANYTDLEYTNAGAEITRDTPKVFGCPILLKVEPPTLQEIKMINPQATSISALQLKTQNKKYFEELASKRVTSIEFEYIRDDEDKYPAIKSLSEIAVISAVVKASEIMAGHNKGNSHMFGNISAVPPEEVVIIDAGTLSELAARAGLGL